MRLLYLNSSLNIVYSGSKPRDDDETDNTGSAGSTGNTGGSNTGNVPDIAPPPPPVFEDGRGGSVDVTLPKPPTPDVKENSSTKEDALYVEETTEFTDEFLASVLEDVVITSYEAASTGLITAASHTTFKSITKSLISKTNKAFIGVGFIVDFGMQIESGKQLGESLIYAAIHSLIAYGVMALCMAYINPVIIGTFIAIVLSAVINTAIDEFIFER